MRRKNYRVSGKRPFPKTVDPTEYILPPVDLAAVSQQNDHHHFNWKAAADRAQIFAGLTPDTIDRTLPLVTVARQQAATVNGLAPDRRHYFELRLQERNRTEQRLLLGARTLPFQEIVNFRDIGGYQTSDGHIVRWGQVYRAGTLAEMTQWDRAYFRSLGIRRVVDLRSAPEVERRPDRLSEADNVQLLLRPVQSLDRLSRLQGLWTVLFQRHKLIEMVRFGYMQVMVEEHAHVIGDVLRMMATEDGLPVVVHCTAGKDRTGLVMALLLHILGVPESTILADYTISNHFYARFRRSLMPDVKPLLRFGMSIDELWPLLVVESETLRDTLTSLRTRYGSLDAYLKQRAGVSEADMAQLRHTLLRPPLQAA